MTDMATGRKSSTIRVFRNHGSRFNKAVVTLTILIVSARLGRFSGAPGAFPGAPRAIPGAPSAFPGAPSDNSGAPAPGGTNLRSTATTRFRKKLPIRKQFGGHNLRLLRSIKLYSPIY